MPLYVIAINSLRLFQKGAYYYAIQIYSEFLSTCGEACGRSCCGQAVSNRLTPLRHINCTAPLSLCYRDDILKPFFEELTYIDCQNLNFQQDSATVHAANETLELIREIFEDRVISVGMWPSWSPDFHLWGYFQIKHMQETPHVRQPERLYKDRNKLNNRTATNACES